MITTLMIVVGTSEINFKSMITFKLKLQTRTKQNENNNKSKNNYKVIDSEATEIHYLKKENNYLERIFVTFMNENDSMQQEQPREIGFTSSKTKEPSN